MNHVFIVAPIAILTFQSTITLFRSHSKADMGGHTFSANGIDQTFDLSEGKSQPGCSVNVSAGPKEDRILTTGLHTVADIFCNDCQTAVGWKYLEAFEESQKYKVGKYILEKAKISKVRGTWD
eukprot:TRINITY_DN3994_c0_g1_i1.p1 TRINITY_DN3994_c0_g1~~TRINITY_DN3994_c0_g1_i1.p1  ORF type:complete len:123 (+),score=21.41 TRINITY_DN3994_c0_g1_i1:152-520(+)